MVRKVIFVLLIGVILTSWLAFAGQQKDAKMRDVGKVAKVNMLDESYGVKNNKVQRLSAGRTAFPVRAAKANQDTIAKFGAESGWSDAVSGTWSKKDFTDIPSQWHVDGFNACAGTYAWWCGDSTVINGGYTDDWWMTLTTPNIEISELATAVDLVYKHWVRCEDQPTEAFSWDGYQVRVSSDYPTYAENTFFEIEPWGLTGYRGPSFGEYDSLWAMEYHGEKGGGFSNATMTECDSVYFDLLAFKGDTVRIRYIFATDGAYNTLDDTTLFGAILDDITVLQVTPDKGLDTLFLEDCETAPQMVGGAPAATGSIWRIYDFPVFAGDSAALDGDPFNNNSYVANMEDGLLSPKIARVDLDTSLADLYLNYWNYGEIDDPQEPDLEEFVSNEYSLDGGPFQGISTLTDDTWWVYTQLERTWQNLRDNWGDNMADMSPLVRDTTWDTLQVAIRFHSDEDAPGPSAHGLAVDNVTISGRIGYRFDVGVTAVKLPWPNANDVPLSISTCVVTNYGFFAYDPGQFDVYMVIVDSSFNPVWGPVDMTDGSPALPTLASAEVPLRDTTFTLTSNQTHYFKVYTRLLYQTDGDASNDTMKTEYSDAKAYYYPQVYNYPAGQGQLRYHDNGLYTYPSVWLRQMAANEIAAVRYDPDPSLYPFDCRLFLPLMRGIGETYQFRAYGPGVDDDHPGAQWASFNFTTHTDSSVQWIRIEVDTVAALQHLSTDFWMGVRFPAQTGTYVMCLESDDPTIGADWDHSYKYTWRPPPLGAYWAAFESDWYMTAVISWRTVDPVAMPSLSGPPKSPGNLHLDWPDVSQANQYMIWRGTHVDSPFPYLDSSLVSNYTDVGAAGDVNTSYYYLFHTVHDSSGYPVGIYDKLSKAIGEQDRSLGNAK